jgi:tRNA threonylcarbamoyladenosine biosynthesis protein TsaB
VILLGIESATELVGVAVGGEDGPRAGVWASGRRRHAEALAPAVAHVLEQAGVDLSDLSAIAVDVGPGLFTGLRVGVATAKGLAQGLGIGVVGLTSLEVLAAAALEGGWPGPVAAVVDARRGEVFAGWYEGGGGGEVVETGLPSRRTPEAFAREVERAGSGVLAVGDGARRYAGLLEPLGGVTVAGASLASPRPEVLVALAARRLAAGAPALPAAEVRPVYLREPDVRINWVQRAGPAAPG